MEILNKEVKAYINELYRDDEQGIIAQMREQYEEAYPIIPLETARFLSTMLTIKKPKKILEVGACIGFSSILMALKTDAHITTIDRYEVMIKQAKANFKKYGLEERITLLEGSALEIMQDLEEEFDFIFIDASKGQYIHFLPEALRLLGQDGIIISDNILQHGDIAKSFEEIEKRQRTIYVNMRKFLQEITHREGLDSSILPIGDGVAITARK